MAGLLQRTHSGLIGYTSSQLLIQNAHSGVNTLRAGLIQRIPRGYDITHTQWLIEHSGVNTHLGVRVDIYTQGL